jgi:hypothetical protein
MIAYGIFASTNAAILAASASALVCATSSSQLYATLAMLSLHVLSTHAALINSMAACSRRCDFLEYVLVMTLIWNPYGSPLSHRVSLQYRHQTLKKTRSKEQLSHSLRYQRKHRSCCRESHNQLVVMTLRHSTGNIVNIASPSSRVSSSNFATAKVACALILGSRRISNCASTISKVSRSMSPAI